MASTQPQTLSFSKDRIKMDNLLPISGTLMLICIELFIVFFLQTLDFSESVIEHIDRKAFGNLGNSIEKISLQGNKLRSLQVFIDELRIQCIF